MASRVDELGEGGVGHGGSELGHLVGELGFSGGVLEQQPEPARILGGDVDEHGEGVVGEVLAAALGGEPGADAVEETGKALAAVAEAFSAHLRPRGVELGAAAWLVTATTAPTCPLARPASS